MLAPMTLIATWNVNSIRTRLPQVLAWLKETNPDIVCLQELKCMDEQFPAMEIEELGYNIETVGQKTYNGVAILSKFPLEVEETVLPGDGIKEDEARYIQALVMHGDVPLRIASIYVPNGGDPQGERFPYKLHFFETLRKHAVALMEEADTPFILAADWNVAPAAIDVYDADKLDGTTCFHPEERKRFRGIVNLGLTDAFRLLHPDAQEYSWWDYRGGGWQANHGMRIDHLLLSPGAADQLQDAGIDKHVRGQEKASDHVPVWCKL